jgi:hypothetical protein
MTVPIQLPIEWSIDDFRSRLYPAAGRHGNGLRSTHAGDDLTNGLDKTFQSTLHAGGQVGRPNDCRPFDGVLQLLKQIKKVVIGRGVVGGRSGNALPFSSEPPFR